MRIAEQTVKNYMNVILRKLRAADRVAILRFAVVNGWVNVGPRPTGSVGRTVDGRPQVAWQ